MKCTLDYKCRIDCKHLPPVVTDDMESNEQAISELAKKYDAKIIVVTTKVVSIVTVLEVT